MQVERQGSLKVLIADDDPFIRRGLALILRPEPDLTVAGEALDGAEAVAQADRLEPDVVLMDLRMPRVDGLGATRLIRSRHPATRIVVLSVYADQVEVALAAGADRFLLKDSSVESLLRAIRDESANGSQLRPD